MIRGIRGAITITEDTAEQILTETKALVEEIIAENNVTADEVASVIISATPDITSGFPAKAVRSLEGWSYVPVMCTHEMNVPNALPLCIRVMMHVNTEAAQKDIRHIFMNDAVQLRPDLVQNRK